MSALLKSMRTPRGQLTMLLASYVVAAAVGAGVLVCRPWFQQWIRYKPRSFAVDAQKLETLVGADDTRAGEALAGLSESEFSGLYGRWLNDSQIDPAGRLGQRLLTARPELILRLVRDTVVAGNRVQILRAAPLLAKFGDGPAREEAIRVLRFAVQRAERRGDAETARLLNATLQQMGP